MRTRFALLLYIMFALIFSVSPVHMAVAAPDIMSCTGVLPDAHLVVIDCAPGYTSQHDRIKIYPRIRYRTENMSYSCARAYRCDNRKSMCK